MAAPQPSDTADFSRCLWRAGVDCSASEPSTPQISSDDLFRA